MVKIKDFTLASKNLGGGHVPPVPYRTPAHDYSDMQYFFDLINIYHYQFSYFHTSFRHQSFTSYE